MVSSLNSWVNLDAASQVIYGMAVQPFYPQTSGNLTLLLEAKDSDGNSITTPVTIYISTTEFIKISHTFVMIIRTDYNLFTYDFNHILWWTGNVTGYFNESVDAIRVLSIEKRVQPSVVITWTNNSINNVIPPYTCPFDLILDVIGQLQQTNFQLALNQYLITSVELGVQGVCTGFTTTTTTTVPTTVTSSTTTTPLTTTSKTTVPTTTSTTPTTTSMFI